MVLFLVAAIAASLPTGSASAWTSFPDADWSARSGFQMALSHKDVIVTGGTSGPGQSLNDVYRLRDGLWHPLAQPQWSERSDFAMTVLQNGTLILSGGQNEDGGHASLNDVWAWDTASTGFRRLPDAPWSHRLGHSMSSCPNNKVVLTGGGNTRSGFFMKQTKDVWVMDSAGSWSQLPDAPWHKRWLHRTVCFSDGALLLAGGHSGFRTFNDVWSMASSGTWTQLTHAAPWSPRADFGLTRLGNILVLGPDDGSHQDAWVMEWPQKSWRSLGKTPFKPRKGYGFVPSPNDTQAVLLAGGSSLNNGLHNFNDVWQLSIGDGSVSLLV